NAAEYTVQYSPDNGTSWLPLAPSTKATEFEFDTAEILGSDQVRFRVSANAGLNTTTATSNAVRIVQELRTTPSAQSIHFANSVVNNNDTRTVTVTNTGTGVVLSPVS